MTNDSKVFDNLIENINDEVKNILYHMPNYCKEQIEEIRLRNQRPLAIYFRGKDYFVSSNGGITEDISNSFLVEKKHIESTFQMISNYSPYAYGEEIRNGYITIKGGHRVGIGGKIVYGSSGIESIRNFSSLNIRVAREKKGISDKIIAKLISKDMRFYNTLIISPPQCGKTTLIRDLVRNLSNGVEGLKLGGFKITIIDERSEIAGIYNGIPEKDIGIRTDVLDGCLKSDGIIMAIRSLSPDIIAVDEIGSKKDIESINEALKAGIRLIATIHGDSLDEIMENPNIRELLYNNSFQRFIILDRSKGVGTIKEIINYKDMNFI